ncbi:MAG: LUD domain-containing protein [Bacteroidetes bacterium]|nr:LUD domain-containing protein [Cryomorphaceae bacterium]MBL6677203.1 LUD domain-containing protein [Flavobacteriaceae bacterium]MDA0330536.1 LUD domain-containing protein [Bacteroidota bacterium]MDA0885008.1 LUD domain-containing protein [Bacteroidota bacterium]MDA1225445.1 LUD domain-containing protein [Bacteroidota bacterium]
MSFWNFFKTNKNKNLEPEDISISNESSLDLIFAKNFTDSGGRFIYLDHQNSTKEIFEKIILENNWKIDNVCSLDSSISKNLDIRLIRNIDNEKVKALVTGCEFLLSNSGRILICNKQIKNNRIDNLPPVVIILARMDQFVSDLSEGMSKLKNKYKTNYPSNITTIVVKNKLNEDSFLAYGNSAKDIYLILSDD